MSKRLFGITLKARPVLQIIPNLNRWRAYPRITRHHRPKR